MRVPLILRFPGKIPPGKPCLASASSVDLAPTILDFLGAPALTKAHGRSLRPYLEGSGDKSGLVFGESGDLEKPGVSRMIRTPEWKLSLGLRGPQSLYDLSRDPGETRNLVADPSAAPALQQLSKQLLEHMKQVGDPSVPRFAEP